MKISESKIMDGYGVTDLFAEGLARVEQIGPCRRLTFVTRNAMMPDSYDVVTRIILTTEALQDLAQMAAADSPAPAQFFAMRADQRAN